MLRPAVTLALATSAVLALTGCGTKAVSAADIENKITADLTRQVKTAPKNVDCPDDGLEAKQGTKITCVLTAPNGDQLDVVVTATSVDGSKVNYDFVVGSDIKKK